MHCLKIEIVGGYMRRFYKESWLGVPFPVFARVSFFRLANNEFYASFYEELFRRFSSWDSLPSRWRKRRDLDVKWLVEVINNIQNKFQNKRDLDAPESPDSADSVIVVNCEAYANTEAAELTHTAHSDSAADGVTRVLTVGLGVGYLEKSILEKMPNLELHVNSPNTSGLRWLREVVLPERIYIGSPANCLPSDVKYHVICLSAVDYAFTNAQLALALRELKAQLVPGGTIVCISASLLEEHSLLGSMVNICKIGLRALLHFFELRRQQFWGWRRTRKEYNTFFENAGFTNIQDGWLREGFSYYWISGE